MAIPTEALQNLAAPLQVVTSGNSSTAIVQNITASIIPPLTDLTATDFLSAPMDVNLNFLTKGVAFSDDNLVAPFNDPTINTNTVDGLPIANLLNSAGLTPGNIGQIAGTLKIPFPVTIPVGATVSWRVEDDQGDAVSDFMAPSGLAGFEAQFIFPPVIEELTNDFVLSLKEYRIIATVTLLAGAGGTDFTRELPPAVVLIPNIGIPVILAMFRHPFFLPVYKDSDGAVLLIVPANSKLKDASQLQDILNTLRPLIGNLNSIVRFASLLTGISMLSDALAVQPHIVFRATDSISDLNDIDLFTGFWNDIEAEDELASAIFIGNPGKTVECYIDRSFRGGRLDLKIGGMAEGATSQDNWLTYIESLEGSDPASKPLGTEKTVLTQSSDFGHELSSLKFS